MSTLEELKKYVARSKAEVIKAKEGMKAKRGLQKNDKKSVEKDLNNDSPFVSEKMKLFKLIQGTERNTLHFQQSIDEADDKLSKRDTNFSIDKLHLNKMKVFGKDSAFVEETYDMVCKSKIFSKLDEYGKLLETELIIGGVNNDILAKRLKDGKLTKEQKNAIELAKGLVKVSEKDRLYLTVRPTYEQELSINTFKDYLKNCITEKNPQEGYALIEFGIGEGLKEMLQGCEQHMGKGQTACVMLDEDKAARCVDAALFVNQLLGKGYKEKVFISSRFKETDQEPRQDYM